MPPIYAVESDLDQLGRVFRLAATGAHEHLVAAGARSADRALGGCGDHVLVRGDRAVHIEKDHLLVGHAPPLPISDRLHVRTTPMEPGTRAVSLLQALGPVGLDNLLVRKEAVLAEALIGARAVVVLVDVNEAIAFAHLAGARGHQVDRAPPGVADEIDAVVDGLAHGVHVLLQVLDAVVVVDLAVRRDLVLGAHAVLHDHQRNLVAIVDLVQGEAQARRVDLPAPVGGLQVGVLAAEGHVALGLLHVIVRAHDRGHVVAEGVEVDRAVSNILQVAVFDLELHAVLAEVTARIAGIGAADLHVGAEPVHAAHLLLIGQDVGRIARSRIGEDEAIHVAHLELRVLLVGEAHHAAARHELVVQRLVALLRSDLDAGGRTLIALDEARRHHGAERGGAGVDLVEGEPVGHLVLVALEHGGGVLHEEVDELAALPAVVLLDQVVGHLVVRQRHERLDAVLLALVEHAVVEGEAGLIRLLVVAVREDAAPGDGHAEDVEAHLGEQRDVLGVVVVEVDAVVVGVELVRLDIDRNLTRLLEAAAHEVVVDARAAPVDIPRALELVGRGGTAPEEALRELDCHVYLLYVDCASRYGTRGNVYRHMTAHDSCCCSNEPRCRTRPQMAEMKWAATGSISARPPPQRR